VSVPTSPIANFGTRRRLSARRLIRCIDIPTSTLNASKNALECYTSTQMTEADPHALTADVADVAGVR
jgi:hypothetical protein